MLKIAVQLQQAPLLFMPKKQTYFTDSKAALIQCKRLQFLTLIQWSKEENCPPDHKKNQTWMY